MILQFESMKKILSLFLVALFTLSACSKAEEQLAVTVEKKPFYIETFSVWKKIETYTVEKAARLVAASSLTLASESQWEVTTIYVKEGQKIKKWMPLVWLKDTVNSYDIRLAQAQNALKIQDANIASTKLALEKAVTDTQIGYEQAKKNYDLLLEKNALVYTTLANTNQKTLESYNENYKSYLAGLEALMNTYLYEWDKIMGMTSAFQYTVDGWKPYLGAKVGNLYSQASNEWNNTYSSRADIRTKKDAGSAISALSIDTDLSLITNGYHRLQVYLDNMVSMIQNDAVGGGLSQAMQDGWIALWNGAKTQVTASEAGFNWWKSQTLSFFKNYRNNEIATKLAVESLKRTITPDELAVLSGSEDMRLTYENTRLDLKDKLKSVELALKQSTVARDNALKNRDLTLNQLSASRSSTELSLEQAERDYSKLVLKAPFDGSVTKIQASLWQRTNIGTPLIEVASSSPEILIDLDESTSRLISAWDLVQVKSDAKIYTGSVLWVARTAGSNLLYPARISVPGAVESIWSAVSVVFFLEKESVDETAWENIILPLKSVKIISEQEGEVALLGSGGVISYISLPLGKVLSEWVEIAWKIPPSSEVILSDLSNYSSDKYILQKKN